MRRIRMVATVVLVAAVLALLVGSIVDFRLYVMVHAVPQDFLH